MPPMGYDILLGEMIDDDDDDLGDDYADLLGAVRRRGTRRRISRRGRSRARAVKKALVPNVPGQPAPGAREYPLPFPALQFNATSGTSLQMQANPQKPFKGLRLVIDLARTGTTSTGLVTLNRIDVGTDNQLVAPGNLPAGAFAPGSFQTTVNMAPATPGISITLNFVISAAPAMTDTVDVAATIIGLVISS